MSEPKVSVVIPMYNVEKYLDTCVQSVRKQTLQNIEIILVDDGSPDRCGDMAEEYAKQDLRIRVVHRENGGLGPARNSGMEVATGEYIGFVDSDDWIEPQMFEELYNAATQHNADICFSGMQCMVDGAKGDRNVNPFADRCSLDKKRFSDCVVPFTVRCQIGRSGIRCRYRYGPRCIGAR